MKATAVPRAWNIIQIANVGSGFLWNTVPSNAEIQK